MRLSRPRTVNFKVGVLRKLHNVQVTMVSVQVTDDSEGVQLALEKERVATEYEVWCKRNPWDEAHAVSRRLTGNR